MTGHKHARRAFLRTAFASALTVAAGCSMSRGVFAEEKKRSLTPNVILLMSDDQGYGDIGYREHPHLRTPELDRMSAEGLRLDLFYSCGATCAPTRASCLTGRHSYRDKIFSGRFNDTLPHSTTTIAQALKAKGYNTGHFGKWHLGDFIKNKGHVSPREMGFDTYMSTTVNAEKIDPTGFIENGTPVKTVGESSQIIMDRTLAYIHNSVDENRPFLAVVWFHTPHWPHGATENHLKHYHDLRVNSKQKKVWGSITAMDEQIGRLRKELRDLNVANNTLLWFCSDNGRDRYKDNFGLGGQKGAVSEGGTRVPAIVEWPAQLDARTINDVPISTVDIYPTLLALLNMTEYGPRRSIDGENIWPILKGTAANRNKPLYFWENGVKAIQQGNVKVICDKDTRYHAYEVIVSNTRGPGLKMIADNPTTEALKEQLNVWAASVLSDAGAIKHIK